MDGGKLYSSPPLLMGVIGQPPVPEVSLEDFSEEDQFAVANSLQTWQSFSLSPYGYAG